MTSSQTSTLSMHKADDNDEVDDLSSDEENFYSQSNEPSREDIDFPHGSREDIALPHGSREDIDLPHGSQESKPNRDHRSSLPRRQKRDSLRVRRDSRDEYSKQLLDSLDRQENEIKDLENKVHSLRKEVRECFSNLDEKLSCFEVKIELIANLVSSWFQHPFGDRRCRGFCTKHVRTDKCLCRGLKEPHRCCGHMVSGLCDCWHCTIKRGILPTGSNTILLKPFGRICLNIAAKLILISDRCVESHRLFFWLCIDSVKKIAADHFTQRSFSFVRRLVRRRITLATRGPVLKIFAHKKANIQT